MRSVPLFVAFLLWTLLINGQTLNPYGHILFECDEKLELEFKHKDHQDYIQYQGLSLKGNYVIQVHNLLFTTDKTTGHSNSILWIYNNRGDLKSVKEYEQNLKVK